MGLLVGQGSGSRRLVADLEEPLFVSLYDGRSVRIQLAQASPPKHDKLWQDVCGHEEHLGALPIQFEEPDSQHRLQRSHWRRG